MSIPSFDKDTHVQSGAYVLLSAEEISYLLKQKRLRRKFL